MSYANRDGMSIRFAIRYCEKIWHMNNAASPTTFRQKDPGTFKEASGHFNNDHDILHNYHDSCKNDIDT